MAIATFDREECSKGNLPPICFRCGERAVDYRKQQFFWVPPVTYLAIFICLPIYIILLFILRKQMTVWLPVCETHRTLWVRRFFLSLLGGFGILGGLFGAILNQEIERALGIRGIGVVFLVLGLLVACVCFFVGNLGMTRPKLITKHSITLKGLSPIFVDTIEQYRILLEEEDEEEVENVVENKTR